MISTGVSAGSDIVDSVASPTIVDSIAIERDYFEPRDFRTKNNFSPLKIGLALSGGGARGIAQIGVLKAFDEVGVDISVIAGTSMGSIIGGLYASGYSATEIEEIVREVDFTSLFSDSPRRQSLFITQRTERDRYLLSVRFDGLKPYIPRALAAGQRLTSFLTGLTIEANYRCGGNFDRLPIPFRAAATDIGAGEPVSISRGSLANAMRASMAFPLAFTPVELDGRYLMDGGIVAPVPVTVCREMGADFIIAVNTVSPLQPVERIDDPVDIAGQVTAIMSQDALEKQLSGADLIITPPLNNIENRDFKLHDSLVALGYQAGKRALEEIDRKLKEGRRDSRVRVQAIEVAKDTPELLKLKRNFPFKAGQFIEHNSLREALLFADRDFSFNLLKVEIVRRNNNVILRLDGEPNRTCDKVKYRLVGNASVPDSSVLPLFPSDSGSVLSMVEVKAAGDSLISRFHQAGYDLAHLRSINYDHGTGTVIITIDEGRLKYVDIRGNERTRDWMIKANYPLRPGAPFDTRKSDKGLAQIYGTGFFERVSLDIQPTSAGAHLTINVKEKKFTQLRLGAHWDDEYQSEMFAELLDDNVFGAGVQVLTQAHLSSRRYNYYLSFKADRLSRTLIMAQTKFYFSRLHRRLFQPDGAPDGFRIEDRLGWSILLGQQIERLGNIYFEYRLEDVRTKLTIPDSENDEVLSVFAFKSSGETFNRFPFPDKGHRHDLAAEFSGKSLGGTYDEYTRLFGSIEGYFPLGNYLNFHPRVATGISTADLPDIEKFNIGGLYNFSGYRTDQLAGDKFFMTNLQFRIKLPYRFYLIGNYDYGNVFDDYEEIKIRDFRKGWGTTLAWDTPLGPFDFGYGKAEGAPYRLYLNIGLRF
jgi:NTE family protein